MLRRVAIFMGSFTLDTAVAVVEEGMSQNDVAEAIESLVDKSMVEAGVDPHETSYRLLDTTRTYALEKLLHRGEHDAIATRHANFLSKLLEEGATSTCLKSNRLHRAQGLLVSTFHRALVVIQRRDDNLASLRDRAATSLRVRDGHSLHSILNS